MTRYFAEPDWDNYERVFDVLIKEHQDAKDVAEHLGISRRSQRYSITAQTLNSIVF